MEAETNKDILESVHECLLQTNQVTNSLKEHLEFEILNPQLLSRNAYELALLIIELLKSIQSHIALEYTPKFQELQKKTKEGKRIRRDDLINLQRRVLAAYNVAINVTPQYKFINGSRAENNPWGIVTQFNRLTKNINIEGRVIIRPRWLYNYSYHPISEDLVSNSDKARYKDNTLYNALKNSLIRSPFYFSLGFPPTSENNILHFALWGHELGHFVDNYEGFKRHKGTVQTDINANYYSRQIAANINYDIPESNYPKLMRELGKDVQDGQKIERGTIVETIYDPVGVILKNWSGEVFADLFSFYLFGPCALLAFIDFIQLTAADLDFFADKDYPPYRVRLGIMVSEYEAWVRELKKNNIKFNPKNQYFLSLEREIGKLRKKLSETKAKFIFSSSISEAEQKQIRAFYEILKNNLPKQVKEFKVFLNGMRKQRFRCFCSPSDLPVILKAVEEIKQGVPPQFGDIKEYPKSEIYGQKVLSNSLNAGWLYWITRKTDADFMRRTLEGKQKEISNLNRLVRKCVDNHEAMYWFSERSFIVDPKEN